MRIFGNKRLWEAAAERKPRRAGRLYRGCCN